MRDAVVALKAAFACDGVNVGREPRGGRRRIAVRPPPRALRARAGRATPTSSRWPPRPASSRSASRRRGSGSAPLGPAEAPAGTVDGAMADDATRDDDVTDALPDDLNASEWVGPYVFPNNNRRRVPGYLYLGLGAACIAAWAIAGTDAVLVNGGFLFAGILLVLLGIYHLLAGWNLDVDERDALVAATKEVGLRGRPRLGPARLARAAQPADLADPPVLRRGAAAEARPRAGRRRGRRDRRPLRGGQPGGLVRPGRPVGRHRATHS